MLKFFELNSIRSRMVSGFLFLTFLILVLSLVSLYILEYTSRMARIHSTISQLEIFTLSLIKSDNDFFDLEAINENYFETRSSEFLTRRDSLNTRIQQEISGLLKQGKDKNLSIVKNLRSIDSTLTVYNTKFDTLEYLVFQKGFRDFGLEGQMRNHAHALEASSLDVDITKILFLRRHEKDFFLRHDTSYLGAFQKRFLILIEELREQPLVHRDAIHHTLEYRRIFLELAGIQTQIGLSSKEGLRNELNNLTYSISAQFFSLSEYSYKMSSLAHNNGRIFYVIMLCAAIFFSVLSGYWISKRLSEPIARLSRLVDDALSSKPEKKMDFNLRNAANEINTLTSSFILLMDQAKLQMKDIKAKSRLLKDKNKQLRKLNRELDNFLYSTAHDLRSPLTSLLGLINLIRHENKQDSLYEYLDMMEKSIHRSEYFITQIVSFSKNKRMLITPEKLDLSFLVSEIFEHNRFIEGFNRIERQVQINETESFYSDRNRITILFNNLISNALKYADPAKDQSFIRIIVVIAQEEATIEFSDNGIGIGEEHLDRIFDMFYRADHGSKGSGLGLFIFRETIKRLNGYVSVESLQGIGTKFFIRLPNLRKQIAIPELDFGKTCESGSSVGN